MGEDNGGGVVHERPAHDLARVDVGPVDGAKETVINLNPDICFKYSLPKEM